MADIEVSVIFHYWFPALSSHHANDSLLEDLFKADDVVLGEDCYLTSIIDFFRRCFVSLIEPGIFDVARWFEHLVFDLVRDLALLDYIYTFYWSVTFIEQHRADWVLRLDWPEQVEEPLQLDIRQTLEHRASLDEFTLCCHLALLCPAEHSLEFFTGQGGQDALLCGCSHGGTSFVIITHQGHITETLPFLELNHMSIDYDNRKIIVVSEGWLLFMPLHVVYE